MSSVVIREGTEVDAPQVAVLLEFGSLHPGAEDPNEASKYADAITEIRASGSMILVADDEGAVVGVCQLIIMRHLQRRGGRCAEIESMHVHPDRRSQGIGALLLDEAARRAQEAGCYRLQLTSNRERSDAHRFYETNGFTFSHKGFKRTIASTEDAGTA